MHSYSALTTEEWVTMAFLKEEEEKKKTFQTEEWLLHSFKNTFFLQKYLENIKQLLSTKHFGQIFKL